MEKLSDKNKTIDELYSQVIKILEENSDKRVIILGTTCTGKTTLLKKVKNKFTGAEDRDELMLKMLDKKDSEYARKTNFRHWPKKLSDKATKIIREKIKVEPGKPIFGTEVLDCDLIIYLKINDLLLRKRTIARKVDFNYAKNLQKVIETEIKNSGIKTIEISISK